MFLCHRGVPAGHDEEAASCECGPLSRRMVSELRRRQFPQRSSPRVSVSLSDIHRRVCRADLWYGLVTDLELNIDSSSLEAVSPLAEASLTYFQIPFNLSLLIIQQKLVSNSVVLLIRILGI